MAKRVWAVNIEVEYTIPVYADDAESACEIAKRHRRDEDPEGEYASATELTSAKGWGNCLPWGGDDRTIAELLAKED